MIVRFNEPVQEPKESAFRPASGERRFVKSPIGQTFTTGVLFCFSTVCFVLRAHCQANSGQILWTNDLGALITSSPTLGSDGSVYLAANSSLYAITNSGSVASNKWSVPAALAGSPAIGPDGTVYFGEGR